MTFVDNRDIGITAPPLTTKKALINHQYVSFLQVQNLSCTLETKTLNVTLVIKDWHQSAKDTMLPTNKWHSETYIKAWFREGLHTVEDRTIKRKKKWMKLHRTKEKFGFSFHRNFSRSPTIKTNS